MCRSSSLATLVALDEANADDGALGEDVCSLAALLCLVLRLLHELGLDGFCAGNLFFIFILAYEL
jgi:hypothetical protein